MRFPVRSVHALPVALLAAGVAVAACSDDKTGDVERFCGEVRDNTAALVAAPATAGDIDDLLELYRRIGDVAPLAVEDDWAALTVNYETASTVEPDDPDSVQRAVTSAYATERSAVAVRDWLLQNCNVDIGPVTTIVPAAPQLGSVPPTTATG